MSGFPLSRCVCEPDSLSLPFQKLEKAALIESGEGSSLPFFLGCVPSSLTCPTVTCRDVPHLTVMDPAAGVWSRMP